MENINEQIIYMNEDGKCGIAINLEHSNPKVIGKLNKINYTNFKYEGQCEIINKNDGRRVLIEYIEIKNIPENLCKAIVENIKEIWNKNLTIADCIDEMISYFSKSKFIKEMQKILLGDIGEALFMIECSKNNIDAKNKIRSLDNSLYDFKFGNLFVEIKSSNKEKNEIKISLPQLTETNNKKIIISKFNIVQGEQTILDLYNQLEPLNELLNIKKANWEDIKKETGDMNIINQYTVILDNCACSVLKEECLPIINIKHNGSLKTLVASLDVTGANVDEFKSFIEKIKEI